MRIRTSVEQQESAYDEEQKKSIPRWQSVHEGETNDHTIMAGMLRAIADKYEQKERR